MFWFRGWGQIRGQTMHFLWYELDAVRARGQIIKAALPAAVSRAASKIWPRALTSSSPSSGKGMVWPLTWPQWPQLVRPMPEAQMMNWNKKVKIKVVRYIGKSHSKELIRLDKILFFKVPFSASLKIFNFFQMNISSQMQTKQSFWISFKYFLYDSLKTNFIRSFKWKGLEGDD